MKRLLLGASTAVLAACVTYLALLYAGFTDPREMGAAQRDKLVRLHSLPSPKIVIVGGSNVVFGIDSDRIQRATGAAVVNMGVNAGISLKYMLDKVGPWLRAGDTVVLALEFENYLRDPRRVSDATLEVLVHDPDGLAYLRSVGGVTWQNALTMLASNSRIVGFLDNRIRPFLRFMPPRIYQRGSFNALGDLVAHVDRPSQRPGTWAALPGGPVDGDAIRLLERFVVQARERGARVVLSWPSVMESQYRQDRAATDRVHAAIRASPVLAPTTSPADYVFPDADFYDTPWHLTGPGRERRTDRLLAEIRTTPGTE